MWLLFHRSDKGMFLAHSALPCWRRAEWCGASEWACQWRAHGLHGTAGGQNAHHQTAPSGKVHIHLGSTQEVLPCYDANSEMRIMMMDCGCHMVLYQISLCILGLHLFKRMYLNVLMYCTICFNWILTNRNTELIKKLASCLCLSCFSKSLCMCFVWEHLETCDISLRTG